MASIFLDILLTVPGVLERDGNKCVISGIRASIAVHHIGGDRSNNDLSNLVTLSKEVHEAIHNGARSYVGKDLEYWKQREPDYVSDLNHRLEYMEKYVSYLREVGHSEATIECTHGHILFGPDHICRKLNIGPAKKRGSGWYRVAVLQPTSLHEEPDEYELHSSISYDFVEQKCEDCPYEGEPPCGGDFHPGPYCFSAPLEDEGNEHRFYRL